MGQRVTHARECGEKRIWTADSRCQQCIRFKRLIDWGICQKTYEKVERIFLTRGKKIAELTSRLSKLAEKEGGDKNTPATQIHRQKAKATTIQIWCRQEHQESPEVSNTKFWPRNPKCEPTLNKSRKACSALEDGTYLPKWGVRAPTGQSKKYWVLVGQEEVRRIQTHGFEYCWQSFFIFRWTRTSKSKLQPILADSTTVAELIALHDAGRETKWLSWLISEFNCTPNYSVNVKGTNLLSVSC